MSTPNIIFMIADDHRHSAINAVGNPEVKTPHLDSLIEQGTTLSHTYIMGSTSPAVCLPSRAMQLSGRSLFNACQPLNTTEAFPPYVFPEHIKLWPQLLREHGYHTHGIGKWHNPKAAYARCFDSGDAIFFGGMSDHYAVPIYDFDPSGEYSDDQCYTGEKFSTDLFTDAATDFLDSYAEDKPFAMYLAFTAPHDPRTPPEEFCYDPDGVSLPNNFMTTYPFDNGVMDIRDEELASYPRNEADIKQHIADYYGMISHLDDRIGQVLTALSKRNDAQNTIIVYTADHGLGVGQHALLGKQNMYEHSMRVPLIMAGPGIPKHQQRNALCYLYDIFPTLCELADVAIPASNEGNSLLPLVQGNKQSHRSSIFAAYQSNYHLPAGGSYQRMVRCGDYKLIEYHVKGQHTDQLFNLKRDPHELDNLADDSQFAELLESLRLELRSWQHLSNDTCLLETGH
ncbi:MAG: sulfatase-like hydrolase/transferase [Deinococcota bacterium]